MENASEEVVFDEEFRLAPIRWIVRAHIALILTTTVWRLCFPTASVAEIASLSVAIAQWGLLLIWLTLTPERSLSRMFAVAVYADLAFLAHMLPDLGPWEIFSQLASVLACMILGHILSVPLLFAHADGLRVRRQIFGPTPSSAPLQFSMSRLLWLTVLAAVLFGVVQAGRGRSPTDPHAAITLAGLVGFVVCVGIVVTWTRVCVWIALTPGSVMPRLAVAAYLWLLGALLLVRDPTTNLLEAVEQMIGLAAATAIVLLTLALVRRQGYYAIWEKEETDDKGHGEPSDVITAIGGTNADGHR